MSDQFITLKFAGCSVNCGGYAFCSTYHDQLMAEYYAAREAYEQAKELACNGFKTEGDQYEQDHPRPTLKQFMTGGKQR